MNAAERHAAEMRALRDECAAIKRAFDRLPDGVDAPWVRSAARRLRLQGEAMLVRLAAWKAADARIKCPVTLPSVEAVR